MIVAVLALAIGGLAQEPTGATREALASLEACVDRVEGTALCAGLDAETAAAELCLSSADDNATYDALSECIVRGSNHCFDRQPDATVESLHAQWCGARARGGVRNAVLRKLHAEAPSLPAATQRQVWDLYGQAVARIETLARDVPEGKAGVMKTAAWLVFAHQLTAPEVAQKG